MIGWILDLLFSNLWLFIILFWAFRMFSKGFKEGAGKPPRRNQPRKPRDVGWETDFEDIRKEPVVPVEPVEILPKKKRELNQREKQSLKEEKQSLKEKSQTEPTLPTPVQGMIWSQIYGPPRSKHAYHRRKTR